VPLSRLNVAIRTLHPQLLGVSYLWSRRSGKVERRTIAYEMLSDPRYLNSPFAPIFEGAGGIRRRLDIPRPVLDFEILEELHAEGATDYVAMPMVFSSGQINALTMASDRRGGFTTGDLGHIYEVLALLGRVYEVHAMRYTAVTLLDTYLGRHAGRRVLNGLIKRGDGENIAAVIWFCDLRESTRLARSMSREDYLALLNRFFDCMAGAVLEHGGEVLRFIGDAALAIFPVAAGAGGMREEEAGRRALEAALDAERRLRGLNEERRSHDEPPIGYGIALHVGEVTYGNIGTPGRLEFTVVGDAANRAARIEAMSSTLGHPVLASAEFAARFPDAFRSIGRHPLRGVTETVEIFALSPHARLFAQDKPLTTGTGDEHER
jgi:adenylate cyclase